MTKLVGKKVKDYGYRDPSKSSTLFGFCFGGGSGLYIIKSEFLGQRAFSQAISEMTSEMKKSKNFNVSLSNETKSITTDMVYSVDEEAAKKILYVTGDALTKYLKKFTVTSIDGSEEKFPIEDVITFSLKDKSGSQSAVINVNFENGSYVRITNYPGDAPVINLAKVSEALPEVI